MKIIEKIEIRYFRSFDDHNVVIEDLKDLNIFSGANDSGKSNILRALNLFFNGEVSPGVPFDIKRDFSINREEEIREQSKPKVFVDITVHFKTGWKTKLRDERFSIKKRWNALSQHSTTVYKDKTWQAEIYNLYREPNIVKKFSKEEKYSGQRSKSINRFLNSIFFFYVPAVKDDSFYSHLYSRLLTQIKNNEDSKKSKTEKIFSTIEKLEELINQHASELLNGIENLKTTFAVPDKLEDFFYGFDLNTLGIKKEATKGISIKQRGDGIRAKSLPLLLELIEKNEKSIRAPIFIWGFEEPENSYEYGNAQNLADKFLNKYSKDKQIFISSHSFNFITIKGQNVSRYRVWKKNDYSSTVRLIPNEKEDLQKALFNLNEDEDKLFEELGVPLLSEDLNDLWKAKSEELKKLSEVRAKAEENDKICILTEGGSDVEFLTILLNRYIDNWNDVYKFINPHHGQSNSAESLYNLILSISATNPTSKFIGIFDNDKAGTEKYTQLGAKNLHENVKTIILPELEWARKWKVKLKQYDSTEPELDLNYKALPIEMYFWKLFEDEFDENEKLFEFDQVPKLPDPIKNKLQRNIQTLKGDENMEDGEKIIQSIKEIKF
ncbi:MAG: AAA family ATPase [Candidatus Gracilibacteria bacterium]|jgi:AAA15 family ATPase/GTPase|nr:AAA family ATPase [Candidatus Gracilibacteria bacterium]